MASIKPNKKIKDLKINSKLPRELLMLETIVGQFMEYWGFKKIHGRIWTHLFTSEAPLGSIELMSRLQVSKGLMSLAIRDLLHYEVILPGHVGRHGSVSYSANSDVMTVISKVLKNRESKMLSAAGEASEKLFNLSPAKLNACKLNAERIKQISEMTRSAKLLLEMFLDQDQVSPTSFFTPALIERP